MMRKLASLARSARDFVWMVPLVAGLAAVLLLLATFAGTGWAIGYLVALIAMLAFNHGAHSKGDGELPPPAQ